MNPEESDISDAVAALMKDLPKPVQDFLMSDERAVVARDLSSKYGLHVDQAAEFERAYIFMLLGIATPEEFVSILSKAGLSQEVINGLAADVNTRVFMRLRDLERAPAQSALAVIKKPTPLPPPALDYQPPVQNLPGSPVPAPMPPSGPVAQIPVSETMSSAPALEATPVSGPAPTQQQGWHPAAAVHIYVPTHPQSAAVPVPMPTHEVYLQNPEPPVAPPAPEVAAIQILKPELTSIPLKKDYAADPYREPIQ